MVPTGISETSVLNHLTPRNNRKHEKKIFKPRRKPEISVNNRTLLSAVTTWWSHTVLNNTFFYRGPAVLQHVVQLPATAQDAGPIIVSLYAAEHKQKAS
jgi:hypothetical protein